MEPTVEVIDVNCEDVVVEPNPQPETVTMQEPVLKTDKPTEPPVEPQDEILKNEIDKLIEENGIAYVYEGQVLDASKIMIHAKTYVIFNPVTGLPLIYDGEVVKLWNQANAASAVSVLRMFTGNDKLALIPLDQLKGKSML